MENIPAIWELVAWCWGSLAEERERTRTGENKPDFMGNWKKTWKIYFLLVVQPQIKYHRICAGQSQMGEKYYS